MGTGIVDRRPDRYGRNCYRCDTEWAIRKSPLCIHFECPGCGIAFSTAFQNATDTALEAADPVDRS